MQPPMYTDYEAQVATESNEKYQGTARVNLKHISPHTEICRSLDLKNVTRLCKIFNREGCQPLEIANHITAVVSSRDFDTALRKSRVSKVQLMTTHSNQYPFLRFSPGQVKCLHGQHRLKAGEEFLSEYDQWWAVDLYLDGR